MHTIPVITNLINTGNGRVLFKVTHIPYHYTNIFITILINCKAIEAKVIPMTIITMSTIHHTPYLIIGSRTSGMFSNTSP